MVSLASVLTALVPARSHAATTPTAPAAFVDLDDDGTYDPGDLPLDQFLTPDSIGFNAFAASGAYKPTGRPVGVVVQAPWTIATGDMHQVIVSGHVRIHANISATRPETSVTFMALGNDIDVASGVSLSANEGDLFFETTKGGRITIGDGVKLADRGDLAGITFDADGPMVVGADLHGTLRGGGYSSMMLLARNGLAFGPRLAYRGPNHGALRIVTRGDLTLDAPDIRCGYIDLEATSDDTHPAAARVRITDGTLAQTYHNGDFRILAGIDQRTRQFVSDSIVLTNTHVTTKASDPLYVPDPIWR